MRQIILSLSFVCLLLSCEKNNTEQIVAEPNEIAETELLAEDYESFGEVIDTKNIISQTEMLNKYKSLDEGDTILVKFKSKVNSVCKMKGCWMKLELDSITESMVKFRDYDFFVPKNAEKSDAIVEGKAYVSEVSVEDLKHYAKDAGDSEEKIAAIKNPKTVYNFEASGVLLKQ